jgi:type VII secretion protein EccB
VQSRRDQAQAESFINRRLAAAVIGADPEAGDQPMRRLGRAAVLSLMAAVLAVAGVTVYGYLRPGGDTSWRSNGVLIVERDSNTRYLYVGGVLHPVLNYTSARLALNSAAPPVATVSAASLRGVPRGLPVGILGAPDDLPSELVGPQWTLCSQPAQDATGALIALSALTAGEVSGSAVPPASGVLVISPADELFLIWQGKRLPLASAAVRSALGYDAVAALPVDAALLSLLPLGPTLAPIPVAPADGARPVVAGAPGVIGAVYQTDGGAFYLLQPGGLVALSPLQARIQLAGAAYPLAARAPLPIPAGAVTLAAGSTVDSSAPVSPPPPAGAAPATSALCVSTADSVLLRPASAGNVNTYTEPVDATGGPLADQVVLPPGSAALVRLQPSPGVTTGTSYLVTAAGVKYPLGDANTAALLGYQGVTPVPLGPAWLQLLRTGPTLDKADALRTVAMGS